MLKTTKSNQLCFPFQLQSGEIVNVSVEDFMRQQIKIRDEHSEIVPLVLNEPQKALLKEICDCLREKKPIRLVVLKARQMGFSTFIAALIFVLTMFQPYRNAIIIAHNRDSASEIFKMYKRFYDYLPKELKVTLKTDSAKELTTMTGSSIRVLTQGDGVARGSSLDYVHLSEAAFYDNLEDTLTAITPALKLDNPESMLFMESTANGFNAFKHYYDLGRGRDDIYTSVFYAWYMKTNDRYPYKGFTLTPKEKEMMLKYHLDYEQISWYRAALIQNGNNEKKMKQENPSEPSDAFIATGNSVFDNEMIAKRKEIVLAKKNPTHLDFTFTIKPLDFDTYVFEDVRTSTDPSGNCLIYKEPIEGHPYVIGIDPARGKGIDNTIFQVIDNISGEQVAIYFNHNEDNDISAAKSVLLAKYYNDALLVPETNTTDAFVKFYMRIGYTNVYRRQTSDDSLTGAIYELYGVKTGYNKKTMVDLGVEICREKGYSNINDYGTLLEMESFVYEQSSNSERLKAKGSGKEHDDKVMALLIAYYGRVQQEGFARTNMHEKNIKRVGFDPLDLNKTKDEYTVEESFEW